MHGATAHGVHAHGVVGALVPTAHGALAHGTVGVLAVKIPSRLKSNMITAQIQAVALKAKLVRLPAPARKAKVVR